MMMMMMIIIIAITIIIMRLMEPRYSSVSTGMAEALNDINNNSTNNHTGHCTYILESTNVLKYNRFNNGTNDISTMNSNKRITATLYSIGT